MHRVFRHVLVWTVAFALVASTAAWRQCMAFQMTVAVQADHGSHMSATSGQHDHHAMHHQHAANEPAAPAAPIADDHGCLKCCALCAVANALPPAAVDVAIFTVSAAVFFPGHEDWTGNTIAVDPGIPKRIV